jgi:predicted O-methyltransferase YrrM
MKMTIKQFIKHIPFAVQLRKKVTILTHSRANERILRQLEGTPYSRGNQIAEALKLFKRKLPDFEREWIKGIEVERKRILHSTEKLVDGSLGDGGLYDADVTVRQACQASKPPKPALLLFLLTRTLKPLNVIELGTSVGISSAYIGAALKLNGQDGKIITLDASPYRQRLAEEVHRNIGLENTSYTAGLFSETLNPCLKELRSIDLAFIDGHHQYQPTIDYFEESMKFSTPDTVFVFDDIRWSDGMKKAWSQIQSDDRLGLVVDFFSVGICVRRQETIPKRFVFEPYYAF